MAANMQNMANAGHLMAQQQQQQRSKVSAQIASHVYQYLAQNTPQYNGMAWQANMTISDRMGKIVEIITNISLAMPGVEPSKAVELGCQFERGHFAQAPNREEYDKIMKGKVEELFRKRQGNEANLQNSLNASARMQAQQAQQAQAMMNAQLGRGMMPQQGFPMQGMPAQMAQQQQQFLQQQQMMMMQNQAGRGVLPQGQAAMMMGGQMPQQQQQQQQQQQPQQQQQMPQQQQGAPTDMSQLSVAEKRKITEFTAKMMAETTDQQKIATRNQVRQRMNPAQLAQFQATNKDPLLWFWQNQAFQHIRATRLQQQQAQGQNQATMMQQQQSQQSLQQRQNMMANAQPGGDFTQFNNMESIKDQQLTGFMAQQAGQMVVPASNAGARNPTPQPGNQNMGPNQTPRPQQQPQPQQPNQQQVNLQQQMNMGQAQNQAQIPGQAGAMNNGMGLGQGMNPAARQQNVMGMAGTPGQRPGNAVLQAMLATMTPDQRQHLSSMPPDKVQDVVRRWQAQRQMQMAGGQMSQGAQPNQFGQMNAAMGAGVPAGAQQPINMGGPGAQQPQMQAQQRISLQGGQIQSMMDNMEIAPPLMAQMTTLLRAPIPPNIKRWKELKMWLTQNNAAPATKQSFANLQQKQFQLMMSRRVTQGQAQPVQSQPAVAMGQPGQQPGMVNQQQPQQLQQQQPQQVQQQQPQQPPQQQQPQQPGIMNGGTASQMTPQQVALMHRLMNNVPPQIMQVSPEEMMNLRAQRPNMANIPDEQLRPIVLQMKRTAWASRQVQAQAQAQAMRMRNQAGGQGPSLGPQPTATQPDAVINNQPPQTTQNTQTAATTKAPVATPTPKPTPSITPITPHQHAAKVKLQANKNLKRPSTDDLEDGSSSQVGKVTPQPIKQLAPDQLAKLSPEERAKYELHLKSQLARNTASAQYDKETMDRLKVIGAEEQRAFSPDSLKEITMTPEELKETGSKLQKAGYDMNRLSKVLLRWYSAARDDSRARMFFRMRLRLLRQFQDGEKMTILKDKFSVRSSELDELRNMMDSMRRDLAMDVMSKQAQVEGTAPVSASADKTTAKTKAVKDNEAPPAPTSTQPPVQIGAPMGAHSPHGTPNYMNKAKDMNLQLPASRKKQRTQGGTVDTPSPQVAKTASPELKRVPEPPKPTFLCKEADCDAPIRAFPTEQALQHHVAEEHIKPREEPLKFLQETLAHALGLEPDGTARKDKAPAMSTSTSKQGQTPGAMGTPAVGMKRSASTASKTLSGKTAAGRADLPPRSASADPWIGATIDKQALLCNLGFEKGLPSLINDVNMLLSNTPNDTPESSKSSEPNSELSDATQIEIDQSWQHFDTDLLLNLDSAGLEALGGDGSTMDPSFLLNPTSAMSTDWNSINVDFSKPFQLDSSLYSMETL